MQTHVFHQILKFFSNYFLEYSLSPFSSSPGTPIMQVNTLDGIPQVSAAFLPSFVFLIGYS